MSASGAWRRRLRRPGRPPSPPESSRRAVGHSPSRHRSASSSSDTPRRPPGRAGAVLRALLLAPLLALPFLAPAPDAAAQTLETLVSNLGRADSITARSFGTTDPGLDTAQSFTTGSNSGGYSLRSVEVEFAKVTTPFSVTATIRTVSGGNPSSTVVGTLTNPAFTTFSGTDQVLTFSSSAGIDLNPNTTYFFMLDVSTANPNTE